MNATGQAAPANHEAGPKLVPPSAALPAKELAERQAYRRLLGLLVFLGVWLLALEILDVFAGWPAALGAGLRLFPYCVFLLVAVRVARPVTRASLATYLLGLSFAVVWVIFLLDFTRRIESLRETPVLGAASRVRRPVRNIAFTVGLLSFFAMSYFTAVETHRAKTRLEAELARLREAEAELRRQITFEHLVTGIMTRFASCGSAGIDDAINASLAEISQFMGVESAFVTEINSKANTWSVSHEYCGPGVPSLRHELQNVPMERLAWTAGRILAGEVLPIHRLDDYPAEAALDRQRAEMYGIKSVLHLPLRGPDGRILGCIGLQAIARQVTWDDQAVRRLGLMGDAIASALGRSAAERDRGRIEAQFRQVQKMEAFGQLAGGVAHDFNNLLTIIQAHAVLAQEEGLAPGERQESLREISTAVERATHLTRQLLTFSRRKVPQRQRLDLNEVVGHMTKMLQRLIGEHIALEARFAPGGAPIDADAGMIEQVLMNLAVNARDAMPKGGCLIIQTESATFGEEVRTLHVGARPGRYAHLCVRDTGCGIPEENLARIFEPFFTTKEPGKGTGLGLATVFSIVEQHQGWITVASTPGTGTSFHLYLPWSGTEDGPAVEGPALAQVRGGNETILLVEDEAPIRALSRNVLGRLGYTVFEAATAPAALALWPAHRQAIQLLLTDVVLPGGMDGRELADRLRAQQPSLRVILCTGYNEEVLGQDFHLTQGTSLLKKPFGPDQLARAVRDALDRA